MKSKHIRMGLVRKRGKSKKHMYFGERRTLCSRAKRRKSACLYSARRRKWWRTGKMVEKTLAA